MNTPDQIRHLPCTFIAGVTQSDNLPASGLPEVAFAGRSNVGKSSLINALLDRKDMARASKTPGRTRQLNFFNLGERLMLVDLPGYGYAAASRQEIKGWTQLTRDYLCGRTMLRRVFVLLDGRHPAKDSDEAFMAMLDDAAVSFQAVLTKADKVKPSELQARLEATQALIKRHPAALPEVLCCSAHEATGITELRERLLEFMNKSG